MQLKHIVAMALTLGVAGFAQAANLTKTVELNNGAQGSFRATTSGDVTREAGNTVTEGRFQNFVMGEIGIKVDGTLSAETARTGRDRSAKFDGNLRVDVPASSDGSRPAKTVTVSFTDLTVVREEGGRHFEGTITLNGQATNADDLPARFHRMLGGLLRMLRM